MKITRRRVVWTAVVVAGVLALVFAMQPRPAAVTTAEVVRGPLRITVDEEGETRLRHRFLVSAPVSGKVRRIELRAGDRVEKGRTQLFAIEPAAPAPLDARTRAAAEARVQAADAVASRARSERQRADVERKRAAEEAERVKALYAAGAAPKDAAEAAEARQRAAEEGVRGADFAIRAAEFEVTQARAALLSSADAASGRAVTVTAPIDGLVLRRLQESETVVIAGAPLIELGDLKDLEIVADLLSTDAVAVRPGAAVTIERWGGPNELKGAVERVEPSAFMKISALGVEEQRVNVVIRFDDPPETRGALGDAFRVEVRILVWERPDVVKVPTSSLFRADGKWAVFAVVDGRLSRREVSIGQRNDREAEVLSGVAPGDRVVEYPGESLTDGTRVTG
jgi:HlyD family secretion protein